MDNGLVVLCGNRSRRMHMNYLHMYLIFGGVFVWMSPLCHTGGLARDDVDSHTLGVVLVNQDLS